MNEAGYVDFGLSLKLILIPYHSIAYVRFDGQMSARRRQEAIARFSIPVKGRITSHSSSQPTRGTRSRGKGKAKKVDDFDYDDDGDADPDFVMRDDRMEDDDFSGEENPRIMLISLKAVSEHSQEGDPVLMSPAGRSRFKSDW